MTLVVCSWELAEPAAMKSVSAAANSGATPNIHDTHGRDCGRSTIIRTPLPAAPDHIDDVKNLR